VELSTPLLVPLPTGGRLFGAARLRAVLDAVRAVRYGRRVAGTESMTSADVVLVERLRGGDEVAFCQLAREHYAALQRIAMLFVPEPATAQTVVCSGWKDALAALDSYDGASSLRTFVGRQVVQAARRQAEKDGRFVPFSALGEPNLVPEASVAAERFRDGDHPNYPGGWRAFPEQWSAIDTARACAVLARAIDQLPPPQRALVALRDVHHWSAAEVQATLGVDEPAQRVHLQRARSKLRALLDDLVSRQGATA
jgi:RNA polymerase sigma-70 factor, ECF subfamily